MTQSEADGSAPPRPPKTLQILRPMGVWCARPDTWSNRRGAMSLLRGLHRRDGWPLVPYEPLAQALGYADRRTVPTFWAECETCGGALAAFLPRRKTVDAEVVARCASLWNAQPCWTCAPVLAAFRRRWSAHGAALRAQNMRTAGHQVGLGGANRGCVGSWPQARRRSKSPGAWRPWVSWPRPALTPRRLRRSPPCSSPSRWHGSRPLVPSKSPGRPPPTPP